MSAPLVFNPERVAYFEAAGWRAYYERAWLNLLRLIVGLGHEQFHIPFPLSWLAAYYVTRAAVAWAPIDHDSEKVKHFYRKFYTLARRYSGLSFDPTVAAEWELRYNDDHRRLVGKPDKSEFIATMTQLHSVIFGITPEQARESAEWRVLANNTVDLITGNHSTHPDADWVKLEGYLRLCYLSVQQAMANPT